VLCCLIGGGLVAWLARSARRNAGRSVSPALSLLFGFGAGAFVVGLIVSVLAPLGVIDVTGPLGGRVAMLVLPAVAAGLALSGGAAGSLLSRSGTMALTVAAVAGALVGEELDLHAFRLHSAPGVMAGVAVHLPGFLFLAAGLTWRAKLPPDEPLMEGECGCPPVPNVESGNFSGSGGDEEHIRPRSPS
jgi:hypothetical protein